MPKKERDFAFVDLALSSWICSFWAESDILFAFNARTGCLLFHPLALHLSISTHSGRMRYSFSGRPHRVDLSTLFFYASDSCSFLSFISNYIHVHTKDGARNYFCIRDRCILGEVKHNKKRAFGKHGEINENSLISRPRVSHSAEWVACKKKAVFLLMVLVLT
jgi:hypothetical protein